MERPLQPVQWALIVGTVGILFWSVPGIFANPDFAIGDAATSVRVMGVDMNGWHALSGFLLAAPAVVAVRKRSWSALACVGSGFGLVLTAVWALISEQVLGGLFYLPNQGTDAALHLATAAVFAAGAISYYARPPRVQVAR